MFCLSKGLSAPVGSMLAGETTLIEKARRVRKMVGGGMRQAGVLAAAGIIALTEMVERLAEDHANARRLAEGIAELPGITVDLGRVETNMVFLDCRPPLTADGFLQRCAAEGVLADMASPSRVRLVTHRGVSRGDVESAIRTISLVLRGERSPIPA
jgi:threonine aldolase